MSDTGVARTESDDQLRQGIVRRFVQIAITILIQGVVLFGASGRLGWAAAWVLLGLNVGFAVANGAVLLRRSPELIAERGQIKGDVKAWDRPLAGIVSAWGPLLIWLVAGLDQRFQWTVTLPVAVPLVAGIVLLLGYALWAWAMWSNEFFAGLVRIQWERNHTVATGGPYRYVRHPGYAGMVLFTLAIPLLLGSLWGLIPSLLTTITAVVRTAMEDRTLRQELAGYQAYAGRVRYRLVPGMW